MADDNTLPDDLKKYAVQAPAAKGDLPDDLKKYATAPPAATPTAPPVATPAAAPAPLEPFHLSLTGVGDTLAREFKSAASGVANFPASVVQTWTTPPTKEEESQPYSPYGVLKHVGMPHIGLTAQRMLSDPLMEAYRFYAPQAVGGRAEPDIAGRIYSVAPEGMGEGASNALLFGPGGITSSASAIAGGAEFKPTFTDIHPKPSPTNPIAGPVIDPPGAVANAAGAVANAVPAAVRGAARFGNNVIEKFPGTVATSVGGAVGGYIGGVPGAVLGGVTGDFMRRMLGPQRLPKIPGENFGLSDYEIARRAATEDVESWATKMKAAKSDAAKAETMYGKNSDDYKAATRAADAAETQYKRRSSDFYQNWYGDDYGDYSPVDSPMPQGTPTPYGPQNVAPPITPVSPESPVAPKITQQEFGNRVVKAAGGNPKPPAPAPDKPIYPPTAADAEAPRLPTDHTPIPYESKSGLTSYKVMPETGAIEVMKGNRGYRYAVDPEDIKAFEEAVNSSKAGSAWTPLQRAAGEYTHTWNSRTGKWDINPKLRATVHPPKD